MTRLVDCSHNTSLIIHVFIITPGFRFLVTGLVVLAACCRPPHTVRLEAVEKVSRDTSYRCMTLSKVALYDGGGGDGGFGDEGTGGVSKQVGKVSPKARGSFNSFDSGSR